MNEPRKPNGWRTLAVKVAVLCSVWLVLALIFAVQFYWIGMELPVRISWAESLLRALIEWSPWMILSPAVVWLAERWEFDRARPLWGLLPHLLACLLVALAYLGISVLLTGRPGGVMYFKFQTGAGSAGVVGDGAGVIRGFGPDTNLPPEGGEKTFSMGTSDILHDTSDPGAIRIVSTRGPATGFPALSPPQLPGPMTRFLHLAAARAQSAIPIYWAIVCVTWVISYYQQLRERERRTLELEGRLVQANLQALKMQLQPHFLFNALNAIASLVRRKPDAAEEMIGALSDFLRITLDTAQQNEVPLRREIEFVDLYLEIQQTRFGDRLRIQKDIDPAALDIAVPTLILQPLVENSIRHGIESRERGGTIWIGAKPRESFLRLEVRDDGGGLKASQLGAFREGVGLSNTKARLQELYGDAHRFQIIPNEAGGLSVVIQLPWQVAVLGATPGHL